jgi:hypothetical protein
MLYLGAKLCGFKRRSWPKMFEKTCKNLTKFKGEVAICTAYVLLMECNFIFIDLSFCCFTAVANGYGWVVWNKQ